MVADVAELAHHPICALDVGGPVRVDQGLIVVEADDLGREGGILVLLIFAEAVAQEAGAKPLVARMVGYPHEDRREHQHDGYHQELASVFRPFHRHEAAQQIGKTEPFQDNQDAEQSDHPERDRPTAMVVGFFEILDIVVEFRLRNGGAMLGIIPAETVFDVEPALVGRFGIVFGVAGQPADDWKGVEEVGEREARMPSQIDERRHRRSGCQPEPKRRGRKQIIEELHAPSPAARAH